MQTSFSRQLSSAGALLFGGDRNLVQSPHVLARSTWSGSRPMILALLESVDGVRGCHGGFETDWCRGCIHAWSMVILGMRWKRPAVYWNVFLLIRRMVSQDWWCSWYPSARYVSREWVIVHVARNSNRSTSCPSNSFCAISQCHSFARPQPAVPQRLRLSWLAKQLQGNLVQSSSESALHHESTKLNLILRVSSGSSKTRPLEKVRDQKSTFENDNAVFCKWPYFLFFGGALAESLGDARVNGEASKKGGRETRERP